MSHNTLRAMQSNPFIDVEDGEAALTILTEDGTSISPLPEKPLKGLDLPAHGAAMRNMSTRLRHMLVAEGLSPSGLVVNGEQVSRLDRVVKRLYDMAELGESWAVKELFDRIVGKPTQAVEISSENRSVLVIRGVALDDL